MKIAALVEYINARGRTVVKGFATEEEAYEFCRVLDKRIERGICGGYLMTSI